MFSQCLCGFPLCFFPPEFKDNLVSLTVSFKLSIGVRLNRFFCLQQIGNVSRVYLPLAQSHLRLPPAVAGFIHLKKKFWFSSKANYVNNKRSQDQVCVSVYAGDCIALQFLCLIYKLNCESE